MIKKCDVENSNNLSKLIKLEETQHLLNNDSNDNELDEIMSNDSLDFDKDNQMFNYDEEMALYDIKKEEDLIVIKINLK